MSQVVKSQVSTGTRTQGLWRTVPGLYPLSYWDPIFWLTLTHLDTRWHIPPFWEIRPRILTRVREMHEAYAQGISYSGYLHWARDVTGGENQISTGTRTQGLWRTVPVLYPLSYTEIFWLTLIHLDTRWHSVETYVSRDVVISWKFHTVSTHLGDDVFSEDDNFLCTVLDSAGVWGEDGIW